MGHIIKSYSPTTPPAGAAPQTPLGAPVPRPLLNGVFFGGAPNGVWGGDPSYILAAKTTGVWAEPQLPADMIHSSQPVWSDVESSN